MEKDFGFTYKLTETGKAQGVFSLAEQELPFETVNASNPIGDLLKAMVSLIQEPAHLWDEENAAAVEWYSDNHLLVLEFSSPDGKTIDLSITRNSAPFGEESEPLSLSGTIALEDFCLGIIQELDKLIKNLGLLNYAQQWQSDEFPLTWFLILKKYLIGWKCWKPSPEEADVLESEFMMILH
jgi:hypothetical protein